MNKETYFTHNSNARNDEKIIQLRMKHGAAGYGIYFMILERLREEKEYKIAKNYEMLAFDFRVEADLVKSVVENFGLFKVTAKYFYSSSFNQRMQLKDEVARKRVEAGKKGMAKRWQKDNKPITNDTEADNKSITNVTETDNKPITAQQQNYNKIITSKVNINISSLSSSVRAREEKWREDILASPSFVETAAMMGGVTAAKVAEAIGEFDSECAAKNTAHTNATDYRRHCYDWLRIHFTKKKNDNAIQQGQQDRRRAAEVSAASAEDYTATF